MDDPGDTPWHLLAARCSGAITPEEEQRLREWVGDDEVRVRFVRAMGTVWNATPALPDSYSADAGWHRVERRLRDTGTVGGEADPDHRKGTDHSPGPVPKPRRISTTAFHAPRTKRRPLIVTLAAAAAAAAIAIGWEPVAQVLSTVTRSPAAGRAIALRETTTTRGERTTFRLDDGTRVTLAPESRLRYPNRVSKERGATRDVYLDGQAYFEVTHDPVRPFVVHARDTDTRVRGTRFVIRAYTNDSTIQVAVNEGEVSFGRGGVRPDSAALGPTSAAPVGSVILPHGTVGRMAPGGEPRIDADASVESYLAWMGGTLVFHDEPLRDVLPELTRSYDVEFRLADTTLATRRLSATLRGGSLRDLMTIIQKVLDVCVMEQDSGVVVISKPTLSCSGTAQR